MKSLIAILMSAALPVGFAAEMAFPGADWEEIAPEKAGLDSPKLKDAVGVAR